MDALGGEWLKGHVEGSAPATGSEFSVLRPDNASGNFTEVVQRLPIGITIDLNQPSARNLRLGMSVITRIDCRRRAAWKSRVGARAIFHLPVAYLSLCACTPTDRPPPLSAAVAPPAVWRDTPTGNSTIDPTWWQVFCDLALTG